MKRIALTSVVLFSVVVFAQNATQETTKAEKKTTTDSGQVKTTTTTTTTSGSDSQAQLAAAKEVPTLDAELGACTAEYHVTGTDGKPVYGAQIHTLIKSRAFGMKKTDLQLSTNYEGRAKFTGLPDVNKRPTFFDIKQGQRKDVREFQPGENCHPVFEVVLGSEVVVDREKK